MPTHIDKPTRIQAAGNMPKIIDEFFGRVNSKTERLSIAHMRSPADGRSRDKRRNSRSTPS